MCIRDREEILSIKETILDYERKRQLLKAQEVQLAGKIDGRTLTDKEWEQTKIERDMYLRKLDLLKEEVTKVDTLLKEQRLSLIHI